MAERPTTSKYAVQRLLAPAGACVQPGLCKKLKLFSLVPLRSKPASERRQEKLREKIESAGISDSTYLWGSNDLVAETKAKTIELRHRTLELLRKVDISESANAGSVAAAPASVFEGEDAALPNIKGALPDVTPSEDGSASELSEPPPGCEEMPVHVKMLLSINVNGDSREGPAHEEDVDEEEMEKRRLKMRSIRGSMRARLEGVDITKMIKKECRMAFKQQTSLGLPGANELQLPGVSGRTNKSEEAESATDKQARFSVEVEESAVPDSDAAPPAGFDGLQQAAAPPTPGSPRKEGKVAEEGGDADGENQSQKLDTSAGSPNNPETPRPVRHVHMEDEEPVRQREGLQKRLQKRKTIENLGGQRRMSSDGTGSILLKTLGKQPSFDSLALLKPADAPNEYESEAMEEKEENCEVPGAAKASMKRSLTQPLADEAPPPPVQSPSRRSIAPLKRAQTGGLGGHRHTIHPMSMDMNRLEGFAFSHNLAQTEASRGLQLLQETSRSISYPSERLDRKGRNQKHDREGQVRLFKSTRIGDDTLTLEVHFPGTTRRKERTFERQIDGEELQNVLSWGPMKDKTPTEQHAWFCSRAFIRHTDLEENEAADKSCVGLKGFDESATADRKFLASGDSKLVDGMRGMLEGVRERNGDRHLNAEHDPKQDSEMKEVKLAAARACLDDEVAVALHDWYDQEQVTSGHVDTMTFMNKICRASGRPEIDEETLARTSEFEGFVQWVDVLCMKFPKVQDMSAWDIRNFAAVVDSEENASKRVSKNLINCVSQSLG